jgi:hypothetical protein
MIMKIELHDDFRGEDDPVTWDGSEADATFDRVQLFGLTETDDRFFGEEATFEATGWLAVVMYELEPGKLTLQAVPLDERHLIHVTCSEEGEWSVALGTIPHPYDGATGRHPKDLIEVSGCREETGQGVEYNQLEWVRIAAVIRSGDDFGSPQQRLRSWPYASSAPVGEGRRLIAEGFRV